MFYEELTEELAKVKESKDFIKLRVELARKYKLKKVPTNIDILCNIDEEAVEKFNLPGDRIGELVVLSDEHTVIGRSKDWHDLDKVKSGLRSHGGVHESVVPMILNRKLTPEYESKLVSGDSRNFNIYDFLFNGTID